MIDDPRDFEDSALTRADASAPGPDRAIGAYRLLQRIGEGGMGEVWLADQTHPIRRRVALKVIKAGMDSKQVIARFEAERQALAVMDHPAVASVFDGGTTPDGRPYFVMEYVKGDPITSYADGHRLAIVDRIALFIQVCEGVQHAHQKGIIHRDLKPSNILVAEDGERHLPKIIDFGVAKATTTSLTDRTLYTELGSMIGTLEYMSPEQAQRTATDIDTRSDVYSLGVILYELLSGTLPFDAHTLRGGGVEEAQRTIRTIDPARPSTHMTRAATAATIAQNRRTEPSRLVSQLRGDLDWIVMKALEKDRGRRYASASDLAADLRRHLENEPVSASPPTPLYRMRKFVRRHRAGSAAAAVIVTLLVVFTVALAIQAARIARERDRASREAEAVKQVSDFLIGLFQVSDPSEARGNTLTAREILDKGAKDISQNLRTQPEVQARLQTTIGTVYTSLGAYSAAEPALQQAVSTLRRTAGEKAPATLTAIHELANLYWFQGRFAEAEPLYVQVVRGRTAALGNENRETLRANYDLASLYDQQKRWDEAEPLYVTTVAAQQRLFGDADQDTVASMNNLNTLYFHLGRYQEALTIQLKVVETFLRTLGDQHPYTLMAMHSAASDYDKLKRYNEAESLYLKALAGKRRVLGDAHPLTLPTIVYLAAMYREQRRYAEAESLLADAYRSLSDQQPTWQERIAGELVTLYGSSNEPGKAAEWRTKLSTTQPPSR